MDSSGYTYKGASLQLSPTVSDTNAFFHAVFGTRSHEGHEYFDRRARAKRFRWASFLASYVDEVLPPRLAELLRVCKHTTPGGSNISLDYSLQVAKPEHIVTMEEIPILATLENVEIVIFGDHLKNPLTVIRPEPDILGDYPVAAKPKRTVCLRLEGKHFSRLDLVEHPVCESDVADINPMEEGLVPFNNSGRYQQDGSASDSGMEYQMDILVMVMLNAWRKLSTWRLSTENRDAGKFDDVVLESPGGAVLLQVKCRENKSKRIDLEELLPANSKKDDFSLAKYFLSYRTIRKIFNVKTLIICTNAALHKKVSPFLSGLSRTESFLHLEGDGLSYTINDKLLPDLRETTLEYYRQNYKNRGVEESEITEENFKDFAKRLQIYFNYLQRKDIEKVVVKLLSESSYSSRISYSEIYTKVKSWFRRKRGEYLNEDQVTAIFSEIYTDKLGRMLKQHDITFRSNTEILKGQKRIYHLTTLRGYLLQLINIYNAFLVDKRKMLCVDSSDDVEVAVQAIEAFGLPRYEVLIIIWPNEIEECMLKEMSNKLTGILNMYEEKQVVLFSECHENFIREFGVGNCEIVQTAVTLANLSQGTQERLLKKKNIVFQGREVALEELFLGKVTQTQKESIHSEVLENMVREEKIKVGSEVPSLDDNVLSYYINRTFKGKVSDKERATEKSLAIISEDDLFRIKDTVVLIEDNAGMGKTTVLAHLAETIKKKHPHLWVLLVELNKYTDILKEHKDRNEDKININELINFGQSDPTNRLEELVFSSDGKVVVMFDGVDEVSPGYTELIVDLLAQCQTASNIAKVLVTTRPIISQLVTNTLQVHIVTIQSFTNQDQVNFLINYWFQNLKLNNKNKLKCGTYAEMLLEETFSWMTLYERAENHFASVPLHAMMLADIFQDECKEYLSEEEALLKHC